MHAAPGAQGVRAGAGAVRAAARRHRAQLPRGARLPRPRRRSATALRLRRRRVQDYIDDGRLARAPRRHPQPAADRAAARRDRRAPVRRGLRRRPPRRGEGPGQGAGLLPARRVRRSGTRAASAPSCGTSTTAGTRPASTCACSRSPTGPSWTSGATSPARTIELPAIYYAHEREVFQRDGMWLTAGRVGRPARRARRVETRPVRYRTVGDMSLHRRRRLRRRRRWTTSSPRSPRPGSPSAARPAPTTALRGRHGRPQARGLLLMTSRTLRCCASPPPARSTTASPPWSAGCCTTPSRCSPTSSRPSSGPRVDRGLAHADLALLTDGLRAEREQGITIDVAYRYFATPDRAVHPRRHAPGTCSTPATWSPAPPPRELAVVLRRRPQRRRRADPPPRRRRRAAARAARGRSPSTRWTWSTTTRRVFDRDRRGVRRAAPRRSASPDVVRDPGVGAGRRQRRRALGATPTGTTGRRCSSTWRPCRSLRTRESERRPVPGAVRDPPAGRADEHPDYRGYAGQVASGIVAARRRGRGAARRAPHHRRRHRHRGRRAGPRPARRSRSRCGWPTTSTSPAAT